MAVRNLDIDVENLDIDVVDLAFDACLRRPENKG